jgi:hypothetical protein
MGQQVQESQVANYRRRMQRGAPAAKMRSLFEQNDVLRQAYTVTVADGQTMKPTDRVHALLNRDCATGHFTVTNCEGKSVGIIAGESGRVLAETLRENKVTAICLTVTIVNQVSGNARVRVTLEE